MSPMMKLLLRAGLVIWRVSRLEGGVWGEGYYPMRRTYNQLEQTDNATPFARSELGKISEGMAQGTGPQVAPNASM